MLLNGPGDCDDDDDGDGDGDETNSFRKLTRWRGGKRGIWGKDLVLVGEEGGEAEGLWLGGEFGFRICGNIF